MSQGALPACCGAAEEPSVAFSELRGLVLASGKDVRCRRTVRGWLSAGAVLATVGSTAVDKLAIGKFGWLDGVTKGGLLSGLVVVVDVPAEAAMLAAKGLRVIVARRILGDVGCTGGSD